ncbi:MAG: tetratricopeptide repeat protein [Desulfurivibrio sp.]|nr:tetratricopeptide repeat protein [Desulfurivibrio sp.]
MLAERGWPVEDRQARRQPESATRRDPADPAGDREYRAVIDGYRHQPIAQRRCTTSLRQRFREDTAAAVSTARGYVRHAPDPGRRAATPSAPVSWLVSLRRYFEGEYQRIYHIYVNEHRHIDAYRPGRLKFIVGRALQELALYRQAAVVYYRALAGTMNEEELPKIYRRRAEVYFALEDYESAQRLLSHLRQLYAENEDFLAEVLYLSGRLRELQRRYDEAREYLRRCLEYPAELPRRQVHVQSLLRVLAAIGNYQEMAELLGRSQKQQWLPPAIAQGWYRRTGDGLRRAGDEEPARQMYTLALAEELPTDNEDYQAAALRLGELLATGDEEQRRQAADYLQSAADGADELLARRARASRNSLRIKELQSEMESLFATEDD